MGFWDAVASAGPYANNLHKGTKNRVSTNLEWMEQGLKSHSTQKISLRRGSSQPVSWLGTEKK